MPKTFHCFYHLLGQHIRADIILCESSECHSLVSKDLHQLVLLLAFSPITLHPVSPIKPICMMSPEDKLQSLPSCFCPCYTSLEEQPLFADRLYNSSLSMTPFKAHFLVSFPRLLFHTEHLHLEALVFCFSCGCSFSRAVIDAWYWTDNQLQECRDQDFVSLPFYPHQPVEFELHRVILVFLQLPFLQHVSERTHWVCACLKQSSSQHHLPKDCLKNSQFYFCSQGRGSFAITPAPRLAPQLGTCKDCPAQGLVPV